MIRALFYLRAVSLVNRVATAAKRLRQPKYLVSSVAGLAYFYFIFLRRMRMPAGVLPGMPVPSEAITTIVAALLLLVFFLRTAVSWNAASEEARLRFSEAEAAFLFAAPLSRRRLIHFHLLGSQLMILFTSVVITFVFNRWSFLGGSTLTHALGWWIILSTYSLYGNALIFISARVQQVLGPTARRKVLGVLAVLAVLLVRRFWTTAEPPPDLISGAAAAGFAEYLAHWIETAVRPAVLYPFAAVVAPLHRSDRSRLPARARTLSGPPRPVLRRGPRTGSAVPRRLARLGAKAGGISRRPPRRRLHRFAHRAQTQSAQGALRAHGGGPPRNGVSVEKPHQHPVMV